METGIGSQDFWKVLKSKYSVLIVAIEYNSKASGKMFIRDESKQMTLIDHAIL